LPGIPIALARPGWQVTLIEASAKKAAFLRQARLELDLANVTVEETRVERLQPLQAFSVVVSRAFSRLAEFVAACRHLVAANGVLAAMKGRDPAAEIAALPQGWACAPPIRLSVPMLPAARHLVLCRPGGRA
jgi:16S rRNA (guanine527-N7)-methyltransferase